jgi:hypothetical protein
MFEVKALVENKEKIMQKALGYDISEIYLTRSLSEPEDYVFLIKCQESINLSENHLAEFKRYLKEVINSASEVTLIYKENLERGLASYKDTSLEIAEKFFDVYWSAIPLLEVQLHDLAAQLQQRLEKNKAALANNKTSLKRSASHLTIFKPADSTTPNIKSSRKETDKSIDKDRLNEVLSTIEVQFPDVWEHLKEDTQQTIKLFEQQVEAKKADASHLNSSKVVEQRSS